MDPCHTRREIDMNTNTSELDNTELDAASAG